MSANASDVMHMVHKVADWPQSSIASYYRRILRIKAARIIAGDYNA